MPLAAWALVAALALLRANRGRAAWLVPLVIIPLLVSQCIYGTDSMFESMLTALPAAIPATWLALAALLFLSYRLVGKSAGQAVLAAAGIALVTGALVLFCFNALSFDMESLVSLGGNAAGYCILMLLYLLAFALAARMCRKKFSPGRYRNRVLLVIFIPVFIVTAGAYGLIFITALRELSVVEWPFMVVFGLYSLIFPLLLYLLALPFLLFMLHNREYRRRFESIFRIPAPTPPPEPPAPAPEPATETE